MVNSSQGPAILGFVPRFRGCESLSSYVIQDMGSGKGKRYACNFPLREGITDDNYKRIFEPVGRPFLFVTRTMSLIWVQLGHCPSHGII